MHQHKTNQIVCVMHQQKQIKSSAITPPNMIYNPYNLRNNSNGNELNGM